jgi:hypothetical protein
MSSNLNYKQVANVKRRTWDVDEYEQKAKARAEAEGASAAAGPARGRKSRPGGVDVDDESAQKRFKKDNGAEEENKEEFTPAEPERRGPWEAREPF